MSETTMTNMLREAIEEADDMIVTDGNAREQEIVTSADEEENEKSGGFLAQLRSRLKGGQHGEE